jgi:hypothetical protein
MKKLLLLTLAAIIMVGCEHKNDAKIEEAKCLRGFRIVVIDSCEYLIKETTMGYSGYGYFAHKGNCKFCAEKRKQELKELVEQLKDK